MKLTVMKFYIFMQGFFLSSYIISYATLHTCELNVHTKKSLFDNRSISSIIPFKDESVM